MDFTDEEIQRVLNSYIKQKEYKNNYYRNKYNNDINFREIVKNRSREWYNNHKEQRKEKYKSNAERHRFMRNKRYAEKNNKLEQFLKKYPDLCEKYL